MACADMTSPSSLRSRPPSNVSISTGSPPPPTSSPELSLLKSFFLVLHAYKIDSEIVSGYSFGGVNHVGNDSLKN